MVNQKDIAQKLGVSQSLVSMVLNDSVPSGRARPEVMQAIKDAAIEMGYVNNPTAKALATGRHGVIGVFIRMGGLPGTELTQQLIHGIADEADRYKQKLWLKLYDDNLDYQDIINFANPKLLDGLIIASHKHFEESEELVKIHDSGLPMARLMKPDDIRSISTITDDYYEVTQKALELLIEKGCQRIVYIGMEEEKSRAYRDLMQNRNAFEDCLFNLTPDYTYESAFEVITQLLDRKIEFDGVITSSDYQAIAVLNVLLQKGINVPDQVKIIGHDDMLICDYTPVTLSSISERKYEFGRMLVNMLMDEIDGKPPVFMHGVGDIVERQSTG